VKPWAGLVALVASGTIGSWSCAPQDPEASELRATSSERGEVAEPAEPQTAIAFRYDQDPAAELRLTLRPLSSVRLGRNVDETPVEVTDAHVRRDRIIVLDGRARKLRGYDSAGQALFAVGERGTGERELDTPLALRVHGDSVVLLDLTHPNNITLYSLNGEYLEGRSFPMEEGATSLEYWEGRMIFTTLKGWVRRDLTYTMVATDPFGTVQWLGCQRDPQYAESDRRKEAAGHHAFRIVARAGDRLFCMQPLTPVVQVHDTAGGFVGAIRRAPAFYRPAPNRPETLNEKARQRFQSEWTAHSVIFPYADGLISVYTTGDLDVGDVRYFLFACDSSGTPNASIRCGSGSSPGQPVGLLGRDTLVVVMQDTSNAPLRLARFLVRMSR
jgi:hypothetical protein